MTVGMSVILLLAAEEVGHDLLSNVSDRLSDRPSCRVLKMARTSWWSPSPHAPRARTVLSLTVPCSTPVGMEVGIPICADARLLLADRVRQAGWSSGWLAQGDASRRWGSGYGELGEGKPNSGVDRPIPWPTDDAPITCSLLLLGAASRQKQGRP